MSARFEVIGTAMTGLRVLQRKPSGDSRGYLERMYCNEELAALTPGRTIMQINHTLTGRRGTVRGMHDQCPLVVPEGFAHGFQTLTDNCELLYLHTAAFAPDSEGALNANDPRLAIVWPQSISDLSARDAGHPLLGDEFLGIKL